jgi:hypothetical protein
MTMLRSLLPLMLAVLCAGLAGCSETYQRLDGVTPMAGDAIAANTVMQMVDPWQYGVQDTDLEVPADRGAAAPAQSADDTSSGGGSGGTTSGGGATTGGSGY